MSFISTIEFVLHFEHFKNIDLFHQGLYFLKSRIYCVNKNQDVFYYYYYY